MPEYGVEPSAGTAIQVVATRSLQDGRQPRPRLSLQDTTTIGTPGLAPLRELHLDLLPMPRPKSPPGMVSNARSHGAPPVHGPLWEKGVQAAFRARTVHHRDSVSLWSRVLQPGAPQHDLQPSQQLGA